MDIYVYSDESGVLILTIMNTMFKEIHKKIFADKKDKQRYLDYAYKIGIKDCFKKLIAERRIKKDEVENIYVFVDEHTTTTK